MPRPVGAWVRFRRHKPACIGAAILFALTLWSLVTLPLSLQWFNVQSLGAAIRHSPSISPVVGYETYDRAIRETAPSPITSWLGSKIHSTSSWLGHDDLGRSLVLRLSCGFLISLATGLAAAAIAVILGTTWGAIAGWSGGRVDLFMMRVVDVLYGLPYTLVIILIKVGLTAPLRHLMGGDAKRADILILMLAIGSVSWLTMARVVRGQVLSLRSQPFVEAARALGAGPVQIILRHILPNLAGAIMVYATLVLPQAMMQEAFLSFLGIGIPPPMPTLGRLASDGVQAVNMFVSFWWLLVFPCGLLVLTLLSLNFLGDGLRDALDPKSKGLSGS